VQERIPGGRARISLGSGKPYREQFDEAGDLAAGLRSENVRSEWRIARISEP